MPVNEYSEIYFSCAARLEIFFWGYSNLSSCVKEILGSCIESKIIVPTENIEAYFLAPLTLRDRTDSEGQMGIQKTLIASVFGDVSVPSNCINNMLYIAALEWENFSINNTAAYFFSKFVSVSVDPSLAGYTKTHPVTLRPPSYSVTPSPPFKP